MKPLLLCGLAALLASGCAHTCWHKFTFGPAPRRPITRVGVLPFEMAPGKGSGGARADAYALALMKAGFEVVDRRHLDSVVEEQRLQVSGAVSPKDAAELGRILGIQGLVTGSQQPKPGIGEPKEFVKLIDVETGAVVWVDETHSLGFVPEKFAQDMAWNIDRKCR